MAGELVSSRGLADAVARAGLLLSRVERAQAACKALLNAAAVVLRSHPRFTPSLFASFTRVYWRNGALLTE